MVQNKLHFAIHGHTAAEVIAERADHKKEHMGLQTWKNAPNGKIIKSDVNVAKNYLSMLEMKDLNQFVSMYLDYAERQARKKIPMTMEDWATNILKEYMRKGFYRQVLEIYATSIAYDHKAEISILF